MRYKVTHTTTYTYGDPVPVCHNQVVLTPREHENLRCFKHRLLIRPTPTSSSRRKDYFGNLVHAFSIQESHRKLTVTASSRVEVRARDFPDEKETPAWEDLATSVYEQTDENWFEASAFVSRSPYISWSDDLEEYARKSFAKKRPILEAVRDLTHRIYTDFAYDKDATHVGTTPEESFRLKGGVCQDFAHVEIACLRSLGIPARYVSGYLRTIPPEGKPRLVGADESHAWLSVYCGPAGWIDVDPTNDTLCGTDHLTLGWGRDYSDVCPIKGVFIGGGQHSIGVSVDVCPMD